MLTPQSAHPLSSTLLEAEGGDVSSAGQSISRGIAKKYGAQSFISYNLPSKFEECLLDIMEQVLAAYSNALLTADSSKDNMQTRK